MSSTDDRRRTNALKGMMILLLAFIICSDGSAMAATIYDGDVLSAETLIASGDNESAINVSGTAKADVSGATIQKKAGSASSVDTAGFCGVNSAVRVYDKAVLTIADSVIETSASNVTDVFAYDGGTIHISDYIVTVTGSGAGGVQVAGGGTLIGENLTVTSASKAAIRSDRGGGTYTSTGKTAARPSTAWRTSQ